MRTSGELLRTLDSASLLDRLLMSVDLRVNEYILGLNWSLDLVGVMSLSLVACGLVVAVCAVARHAPKRLVTAICSCSSSAGGYLYQCARCDHGCGIILKKSCFSTATVTSK